MWNEIIFHAGRKNNPWTNQCISTERNPPTRGHVAASKVIFGRSSRRVLFASSTKSQICSILQYTRPFPQPSHPTQSITSAKIDKPWATEKRWERNRITVETISLQRTWVSPFPPVLNISQADQILQLSSVCKLIRIFLRVQAAHHPLLVQRVLMPTLTAHSPHNLLPYQMNSL